MEPNDVAEKRSSFDEVSIRKTKASTSHANKHSNYMTTQPYRGNSFTGDLNNTHNRISIARPDQRQTAEITKRKFEELFSSEFWKSPRFFEDFCEILFHIKKRKTTIRLEIYCGVIQFISCMVIIYF